MLLYLFVDCPSNESNQAISLLLFVYDKVEKIFFKPTFLPKKWTNKFDFTTMIPQVDLFSFGFWKKLKTPKRYFEINWPLAILFMRIFIKHLVKRNHRNSKAAIVLCKNKKKPGQIFMLYFVIRKGRNSYLEY